MTTRGPCFCQLENSLSEPEFAVLAVRWHDHDASLSASTAAAANENRMAVRSLVTVLRLDCDEMRAVGLRVGIMIVICTNDAIMIIGSPADHRIIRRVQDTSPPT
jgi:hypothetical protein